MASSSSSSSAPSKGPAGGWGCVYFKPGEKGLERRRELEEIFTEQECGGLECRTCGYALSAAVLLDGMEKTGGVGALGIMSSHRGGGGGGRRRGRERERRRGGGRRGRGEGGSFAGEARTDGPEAGPASKRR